MCRVAIHAIVNTKGGGKWGHDCGGEWGSVANRCWERKAQLTRCLSDALRK